MEAYPGHFFREGASNQRARNRANGVHTADDAKVLPSQPQWNEIADDELGKHDDTATADTLDRPAGQKDGEVLRKSTYEKTEQEHDDRCRRDPSSSEDIGKGGDGRLEDGGGEQVRRRGPERFERAAVELLRNHLGLHQHRLLSGGNEGPLTGSATERAVASNATITVSMPRVANAIQSHIPGLYVAPLLCAGAGAGADSRFNAEAILLVRFDDGIARRGCTL